MATRREMQERRAKLREQLVEACNDGSQKAGAMLPPLRELAQKYGVSPALASEVVRSLADEGLLYTQKGAGTFIGKLSTRDDLFLLVVPDIMEADPDFFEIRIGIRNGFESALARLGGTCLTMTRQNALDYRASGQLQGLAGVGEFCSLVDEESWDGPEPHVALREMWVEREASDQVFVDNEDAGRQATQHLLSLGHRSIAFLGVNQEGADFASSLDWSRQRQVGWQSTLKNAGCSVENLAFCPHYGPENSAVSFHEVGLNAGREMVRRLSEKTPAISAVIASNGHSTEGMFEAFREAQVPEESWPAVVSFDDYMAPNNHLLSVLRPSWEDLGRQGATLLWERVQGRLDAGPQRRPVSMELIPRFSCRPQKLKVPLDTINTPPVFSRSNGAIAAR